MRKLRPLFFSLVVLLAGALSAGVLLTVAPPPVSASSAANGGALRILKGGEPAGFCPLRNTQVQAGISGFMARVVVTQDFHNPSHEPIEAVYTFPLPQDAAVDDMTITIGERTIRAEIKRREEAAKIYQQAIEQGKVAARLDQERPNIFSQTVGNIPPGESVRVTIRYLAPLKYEDGGYEFVFPMVVAERYIPGSEVTGKQGGGWAPDTDQVPDASKITPPIAPPGKRAGHDISISLMLDAGVPIQELRSPSHEIDFDRTGGSSAMVRLRKTREIPNRDFILRYDVAGGAIAEGLLTHAVATEVASAAPMAGSTRGFFTLILQPPARVPESDITPKELVFVLDSSGSMNGFPIEKSKQLMQYALDSLYPGDTFNIIKFSGETAVLFEQPVYPSAENVRRAREFVNTRWGGGGTEMMKAIRAALAPSASREHVRIVVFLTDGLVGNDMEIIAEIQKHTAARVFAFGIGSSINRFLLDKMAEAGRGEVQYVSFQQDNDEAEHAARLLYERLRAPLLTDIELDFGSLPVAEVYPAKVRDLFSGRPVVVTGRYTAPAQGTVRLRAKHASQPYSRDIPVAFPARQERNPALATLWARQKVEHLMAQDWVGAQRGAMRPALREQITGIALEHRLMTQFTSFVAVEDRVVTEGGRPRTIQVPVELPAGMQHPQERDRMEVYRQWVAVSGGVSVPHMAAKTMPSGPPPAGIGAGGGGGVGSGTGPGVGPGSGGGIGGGVYRVGGGVSAPRAIHTPDPQYSEEARKARVQGTVVLAAIIGTDGTPIDLKVVRSLGMGLDQKAIEAVRKWRFSPAMKDGKPVSTQVSLEVNFRMDGAGPRPPARSLESKLHPRLVAAYDCWQEQTDKSQAASACKLEGERLLVKVVVAGEAESALRDLQALGFAMQPRALRRNQYVGWIRVEQLAALAELKTVQFVGPGETR